MFMIRSGLLILLSLLLFSCSVQKRKYRDGFFVSWLNGKSKSTKQNQPLAKNTHPAKARAQVETIATRPAETLLSSASQNTGILKHQKTNVFTSALPDSCDLIIFRDGTETRAKVSEIMGNSIKYKRCDFMDGPAYTIDKSKVFMIKYSNGVREVMKAEPVYTTATPQANRNNRPAKKVLNVKAIFALITGILGLIFFTGIAAILLGNKAISEIDNDPDKYSGRGLAQVGRILGYIKLSAIVTVLALIILAALLA